MRGQNPKSRNSSLPAFIGDTDFVDMPVDPSLRFLKAADIVVLSTPIEFTGAGIVPTDDICRCCCCCCCCWIRSEDTEHIGDEDGEDSGCKK